MVTDFEAANRATGLRLIGQVERLGVRLLERYGVSAPIDNAVTFSAFAADLLDFQLFFDLLTERLPSLAADKREAVALRLKQIRDQIHKLELRTTRGFLESYRTGARWPTLGLHELLERRRHRLAEIAEENSGAIPRDEIEALIAALDALLKAVPPLPDFRSDDDAYDFRRPPDHLRQRLAPAGRDAIRLPPPQAGLRPVGSHLRFVLRDGRIFADAGAFDIVTDFCNRRNLPLESLAAKLGISRGQLVLMLKGTDPLVSSLADELKKLVYGMEPANQLAAE